MGREGLGLLLSEDCVERRVHVKDVNSDLPSQSNDGENRCCLGSFTTPCMIVLRIDGALISR